MSSSRPVTWPSLFAALMYAFMYFPIIVLGVYSFNDSRYSASWEGFSLRWYRALLAIAACCRRCRTV
jgi:spermidine/putrescine transport system permease protein